MLLSSSRSNLENKILKIERQSYIYLCCFRLWMVYHVKFLSISRKYRSRTLELCDFAFFARKMLVNLVFKIHVQISIIYRESNLTQFSWRKRKKHLVAKFGKLPELTHTLETHSSENCSENLISDLWVLFFWLHLLLHKSSNIAL